jgi:hypothetical protein
MKERSARAVGIRRPDRGNEDWVVTEFQSQPTTEYSVQLQSIRAPCYVFRVW